MIYMNNNETTPELGTDATIICWTDLQPCKVTKVNDSRTSITVTRTDERGNGNEYIFTLRKNGRWVRQGDPQHNGQKVVLGVARESYDYSF